MQNSEYIHEMLDMQQELNDATNGKGWENGYTKNERIINWKRCIYMESAELIDSFNWKHWKDIDKDNDWDNATIEIVDIWHFIMSLLLENYKICSKKSVGRLVKDIVDTHGFDSFAKEPENTKNADIMEIINDIESIINITTSSQINLFDGLLKGYFAMALKCGVNLKILYKFYIAKNVLNQFRQDNGYKEGSYRKIWGVKEDNEVMIDILNTKAIGAKELYSKLDKIYNA